VSGAPGESGEREFDYLRAEHPESWQKPSDVDTWGDWTLKPGRALSPRHKELCRLFFLGKTNSYIAETLGFTESRVSVLRSNTQVQAEITRLQELAFERTVGERLKEMGPQAANILEEILTTEDPNVKMSLKKETAVWVLEKLTGRPKQDIDIQSSTLGSFIEMLNQMKASDQTLTKDVTPALASGQVTEEAPVRSDVEAWVAENL
jgi:DNA-binding CsgD family transcriptional regulator